MYFLTTASSSFGVAELEANLADVPLSLGSLMEVNQAKIAKILELPALALNVPDALAKEEVILDYLTRQPQPPTLRHQVTPTFGQLAVTGECPRNLCLAK